MKQCSTTLIIKKKKKNEVKTTMSYPLTMVRMAIISKSKNNKCWRGYGEKGTLPYCWWEDKLVLPLRKIPWRFLKKLKIELHHVAAAAAAAKSLQSCPTLCDPTDSSPPGSAVAGILQQIHSWAYIQSKP